MKRLIQVYKGVDQWGTIGPPGFGDFIRGICHLYEMLENHPDVKLYVDFSQSEFGKYISSNSDILSVGNQQKIIDAPTYFVDHPALRERLKSFIDSDEKELYLSTNIGDWNRTLLPNSVKEFARQFYKFDPTVEQEVTSAIGAEEYAVLSIRCGDHFFQPGQDHHLSEIPPKISDIIENFVLQQCSLPILVTSDHYELKILLAKKYGFLLLNHKSEHGAYGNVLPVIKDLCALKNSSKNFYINAWTTWWSGFSHYTSIIFDIPSLNFRHPEYIPEYISRDGTLTTTI